MDSDIESLDHFESLISQNPAVLACFSTPECNVCKAMKPKVLELIKEEFPLIKPVFIEISSLPEVAARYRVFTVPTWLVFFDGKEYIRKSRNFGLNEFKEETGRLYSLMF